MDENSEKSDFRFSSEKNFPDGISLMKWSEKRDLLVMATEEGKVLLHRFEKLERAWVFKELDEFPNAKITSLCWRPDGRVICVAYSYTSNEESSFFKLLTEEGPIDLFEEIGLPAKSIFLSWTETIFENELDKNLTFFPELTPIDKENNTTLNCLVDTKLNILIVTLATGEIAGYVFGVVPLFLHQVGDNCLRAEISPNLETIHVIRKNSELVHIILDTEELAQYQSQIHRYVTYVITAQLCVSYLQKCIDAMKTAWVDALDTKLAEFASPLLLMYLWGIQTPELTHFISEEMERSKFYEIALKTREKCAAVQSLCIINCSQACEKLFSAIHQLSALSMIDTAFGVMVPIHEITFSIIRQNVAQLSIKNIELVQVICNLLEEAVSFGDWFTPQLVRLNDENAQNSSLVTEHSSSDEERVIRFIRNHLKVDHVVQYFEQESLKNPYTKNSENNWKKLLEKHKVKSGIIYETESKVSLRTSLDYTRRLLTKLCFRDESGRFGCPKSRLSDSISIKESISVNESEPISSSFGTRYYCLKDKGFFYIIVGFSSDHIHLYVNQKNGKEHSRFKFSTNQWKIEDISIYDATEESCRVFTLMTNLESSSQYISIIELNPGTSMNITKSKQLFSSTTFGFVAASSFRENCAVLSSTRKIIQSFELNEDDEDES